MNFLAHSLLGFDDQSLIAGQFCGDFVRGSDLSQFPVRLETGIRLHRHLDRFTDTHPVLAPPRANMPDVPRRIAGIVVDVMFDHYLAQRWEQVSALSLEEHAHRVQLALLTHHHHLPDALQRFMRVMERDRILQSNVKLKSIETTLSRIASRSPGLTGLALSVAQLEPINQMLEKPFDTFLPDLNTAAHAYMVQPQRNVS